MVRKVGGSRSLLRSKSRAALTSQKTSFSVLLEENQKSNSLERIFLLDTGSSDVNQKVLTTNLEYHVKGHFIFEIPLSITEFYFWTDYWCSKRSIKHPASSVLLSYENNSDQLQVVISLNCLTKLIELTFSRLVRHPLESVLKGFGAVLVKF